LRERDEARGAFAKVEKERDEADDMLDTAAQVARRSTLKADLATSAAKLREAEAKLGLIYDMTEGYADGAPDAVAHDKLCNEISSIAKP
jgi:hypothetical protein